MKRPLLVIGVSYAIATWASFLLFESGSWAVSALLAALGGLLGLWRRHGAHRVAVPLLAAGIAVGAHAQHHARRVEPLQALDGEQVAFTGVIVDADVYQNTVDYTVLAAFPGRPDLPQRSTLRVRAYEIEHAAGDAVSGAVRISALTGSRASSYSGGVFVRATLAEGRSQPTGPYEFTRLATNVREGMRRRLYRRLDGEAAAMVSGMALGVTRDIPAEDYAALNRSGISHLLSVSGLHLSVLTGLLLGLLRGLRCPAPAASLLALFAGFLFAGLVGFSSSILRALLMLGVYLASTAFSGRSDALNALGFALLVICALYPHWTLGRGLWLSFASTAGIILFASRIQARVAAWLEERRGKPVGRVGGVFLAAFAVSCTAYAFTLPVMVLTTGWFSLISPYANMLVAPLIVPALAGGLLCGLLPLAAPLGWLTPVVEWCAGTILRAARLTAALPFAVFAVDSAYRLVGLAGLLALAALLVKRRAARRQAAVAVALCVFCLSVGGAGAAALSRGELEIVTIDGCSQTVLLRGGRAVIVGTPTQYDAGRLVGYLQYRGVREVSAVVATDSGDQLTSGLPRLCASFDVGHVFGPDDAFVLGQLTRQLDSPVHAGGRAEIRVLDGVRLQTRGDNLTVDIRAGGHWVRKTSVIYGILGVDDPGALAYVYDDGTINWRDAHPPAWAPVGGLLYGETRLVIKL